MSSNRFDDLFNLAKSEEEESKTEKPKVSKRKKTTRRSQPKQQASKPDPWAELQPEEREATIRLNVDIPVTLNDALATKARKLRTDKSKLVRKLLEWALEDEIE